MSFLKDLRFQDPEGLVNRAAFNERFETLNRLNTRIGDEWVWEKGTYSESLGNDLKGAYILDGNVTPYGFYSDSIGLDAQGRPFLINPEQIPVRADAIVEDPAILRGKYIQIQPNASEIPNAGQIAKVSDTATFYKYIRFLVPNPESVYLVEGSFSVIGYVNSPDPNAYPPAEPDGYTYTSLGQLGDKVRIATGSYIGTGTYGSENPNTLTFDFEPKYILITQRNSSGQYTVLLIIAIRLTAIYDNYVAIEDYGRIGSYVYAKRDNFTVSWYANGASSQSNGANKVYDYLALG